MKTNAFLALILLALTLLLPMSYAGLEDTTAISVTLLNQDPDPAIAGDIVEVRIGVANLGGKVADNFVLEFSPSYPFELVPGESAIQKIGTLNAYQGGQTMKIAKYRTKVDKDTIAGSYELKINYYREGLGGVVQKSLPVDVRNKESAQIIHIDKTLLVPGKQESLIFTINNVGNAPLRDLTFSWVNDDKIILPVGSDNTRYIKYIDVGGSVELEYRVIADTNAVLGLYQLDLQLTYAQSGDSSAKQISTIAGVYVGGGTDFDVAFSDSSGGSTSFSVANVGSTPANSVSVIIPEQRGWRVTGSNSAMIGNLNKGDYTVASFNLQPSTGNMTSGNNMNFQNRNPAALNSTQGGLVQRSANGSTGALLIQIAYTDTMGERHIVEKEVRVGAQSAADISGRMVMQGRQMNTQNTGFFSQYGTYIAAISILAAGFVLYQKYKKRKLIDPGFTINQFLGRKKK